MRIACAIYLCFSDVTFAKGLHINFAALTNGQKVFRNNAVSSGTPKLFQEMYIKHKCKLNALLNVIS